MLSRRAARKSLCCSIHKRKETRRVRASKVPGFGRGLLCFCGLCDEHTHLVPILGDENSRCRFYAYELEGATAIGADDRDSDPLGALTFVA
jgi:hypothetical protein